MTAALESLLKRDRAIVGATLVGITGLAWAYLVWIENSMTMPGASMADMPDMNMAAPAFRAWTVGDIGFTFAMWAVMMVGMMTPSIAPMVLLYARVGRQAALQNAPFAAAGWFAGGYLLSWTAFSLLATVAQALLERAALLTPMMTAASPRVGGVILVAAGFYQWVPFKDSCLKQCRAPLAFIQNYGGFKRDAVGSLGLGLRHGFFCIGCCWALMALLFAGGVMNVLWIAAIAGLVLIEKVVRAGRVISNVAGIGFLLFGLWLLVAF
jgi:predicted metal-binding membrane protein